MCCAAMGCHFGVLRILLEAHRARGTLTKALESPCRAANGTFSPLIHHAVYNFFDATLDARLATVRMLVEEFGVDTSAYYPGAFDEVLPLLTAAFVGEVAVMDLLICGRYVPVSPPLSPSPFPVPFDLSASFIIPFCHSCLPLPAFAVPIFLPPPSLLMCSFTVLLACIIEKHPNSAPKTHILAFLLPLPSFLRFPSSASLLRSPVLPIFSS